MVDTLLQRLDAIAARHESGWHADEDPNHPGEQCDERQTIALARALLELPDSLVMPDVLSREDVRAWLTGYVTGAALRAFGRDA